MPWKTRAENKLCGILLVCVCARSHMGAVLLAGRDPVEAPRAAPSQPVAAVVDHGLQDLLPGALPDESGHLAARVPQPARPGVVEPPDGLPGRPGEHGGVHGDGSHHDRAEENEQSVLRVRFVLIFMTVFITNLCG